MYKKIGLTVCLFALMFAMASCGEHEESNADISSLEIQYSLPLASGGSTTLEDAGEAIYQQQVSLCEAYYETYQLTDIGKFTQKYPDAPANRLAESLSNKRKELNDVIAARFFENMNVILEDVTDCKDKERYIEKCYSDARYFFNNYNLISNPDVDNFERINDILVSFADSNNAFAKQVFLRNRELMLDMAIRDIEYNAAADTEFRANISKNNDTIDAINDVFGGISDDKELRSRMNDASMTLLKKLLDTMETMTEYERQSAIEQLEEYQRMSAEEDN